ncbi:MAG TPA: hypothetical protein PKM88_05495 [bacterium]|nr:hypothetical protein [bacterium]
MKTPSLLGLMPRLLAARAGHEQFLRRYYRQLQQRQAATTIELEQMTRACAEHRAATGPVTGWLAGLAASCAGLPPADDGPADWYRRRWLRALADAAGENNTVCDAPALAAANWQPLPAAGTAVAATVILAQALDGADDPARVLARARRLLADGGTLHAMVTTAGGAWSVDRVLRLAGDFFPARSLAVTTAGNRLAAALQTQGLPARLLADAVLLETDAAWPVVAILTARRPRSGR